MSSGAIRTGPIRMHHHSEFPLERLAEAKGTTTVSVCLPARNEESTVGHIVEVLRCDLLERGLIDELWVIDDHSEDGTARVAADAGARVVAAADVLPRYGSGHGKGEVLWKSLLVTEGDIVLWCDADLRSFDHRFVSGLLGPLLCEEGIDFVKGFYERPESDGEGGGRVTELVARPLIALLFPRLAGIEQPLSGEYGGRRSLLEQLPFVEGYGVEMGMLIDLARRFGTGCMAQVDLEIRHHRNRTLGELSPQAAAITQTVLRRVDRDLLDTVATLRVGDRDVSIEAAERPPMIEVAEYLDRHRR
ncbi:MAG: glucosyl-3-phosphoglycerate synthase [Microthrixaceae bacterium]